MGQGQMGGEQEGPCDIQRPEEVSPCLGAGLNGAGIALPGCWREDPAPWDSRWLSHGLWGWWPWPHRSC